MSGDSQPTQSTMPTSVEVVTGSRLHFGLLTDRPPDGSARRSFGGVGAMIDQPGWSIRLSRTTDRDTIRVTDRTASANVLHSLNQANESESVVGNADLIERAKRVLCEYREHHQAGPVELEIQRVVPSHLGFGSGTQLALAIGRALDELHGIHDSVDSLARRVGRGKRSAVGTWGFGLGCLIIDAGKTDADSIGGLECRVSIPTEWRFVLLTDSNNVGINGEHEAVAFDDSPGMPQELTDALCRIALTEIAPAFSEQDHSAAAQALDEYGNRVGKYFSKIQGGTFSSPDVARVVAQLRFDGVAGITQTSWGPTCSVLCADQSTATAVANRVNSVGGNVTATVVQPLNSAARVTTTS